ncbi:MAG: flagellar protein FliT [Rhodoferax sp.]
MSQRLRACEKAWNTTCQMLEAARQGLWDDLPALQGVREAALGVLADPQLPVDTQTEMAYMQKMLAVEPELMALVQTQRSELSRLLRDRQTGRSMTQIYVQISGMSNNHGF